MTVIPETHVDLLERPLFAHFGTIREDGWPQVNPMWFAWDGACLRLTGTTTRYKFRNIRANPRVTLSINDPDQPYRYLEIRGTVVDIRPDPDGAFFAHLAHRYRLDMPLPPGDVADRIVYTVHPERSTSQ